MVILAETGSPAGPGEHSRVYGTLEKPSFNIHAISSALRRERLVKEKGSEGKKQVQEVQRKRKQRQSRSGAGSSSTSPKQKQQQQQEEEELVM